MLNHISLFAGIGGDSLAAEWAGFEHLLFCEIDDFCQRVLRKNFPRVPIIGDVHDVTEESVVANTTVCRHNRKEQSELCRTAKENGDADNTSDGNSLSRTGITLLTAGVPCQPASTAGKRRGKADDRWLWPEAIRVLSELKPSWAVFENPVGIGSLGELGGLSEVGSEAYQGICDTEAVELSNIIRDIEAQGYEVQSVCIPACAVGAPHRRDRIFIIAHSKYSGSRTLGNGNNENGKAKVQECGNESFNGIVRRGSQLNSHAHRAGLERYWGEHGLRESGGEIKTTRNYWSENWIEVATRFCRVDARIPDRVDRLKALGNAIAPQQIYPILKAIADIESNK